MSLNDIATTWLMTQSAEYIRSYYSFIVLTIQRFLFSAGRALIHSLLNEWTGFRADQFRQNLRSHRRSWSEFFIFIILSARGGVVWVDRSVWCESERTQIHYYNVDLIYIATLWFQGESPTYILNPFRAPEPLPILYPSNLVPKNGFPVVKGLMRTHNP